MLCAPTVRPGSVVGLPSLLMTSCGDHFCLQKCPRQPLGAPQGLQPGANTLGKRAAFPCPIFLYTFPVRGVLTDRFGTTRSLALRPPSLPLSSGHSCPARSVSPREVGLVDKVDEEPMSGHVGVPLDPPRGPDRRGTDKALGQFFCPLARFESWANVFWPCCPSLRDLQLFPGPTAVSFLRLSPLWPTSGPCDSFDSLLIRLPRCLSRHLLCPLSSRLTPLGLHGTQTYVPVCGCDCPSLLRQLRQGDTPQAGSGSPVCAHRGDGGWEGFSASAHSFTPSPAHTGAFLPTWNHHLTRVGKPPSGPRGPQLTPQVEGHLRTRSWRSGLAGWCLQARFWQVSITF